MIECKDNLGKDESIVIQGDKAYKNDRCYGDVISFKRNKLKIKVSKEYNMYMDGCVINFTIKP